MCERFGTLPNEGGILDQDHLLIRKLALVFDALAEKRRQSAKGAKGNQKGK